MYSYTSIFFTIKANPIIPEKIIAGKVDNPPNIYILIVDGYANNQSLKKYWNYDNSEFTNQLKNFGFKHIPNSKSNYGFTIETISSMFNYNYIPDEISNKTNLIIKYGVESSSIDIFHKNGYKIFNFSLVDFEKGDRIYKSKFYTFKKPDDILRFTKQNLIFNESKKNRLYKNIEFFNDELDSIEDKIFQSRTWRDSVFSNKIDSITVLKKQKKLVIFHYNSLHQPFNYKELNRFEVDSFLLSTKKSQNTFGSKRLSQIFLNLYLSELKKANVKFLKIIENILKKDPNSIIMFMSDHGFRYLPDLPKSETNKETFMNFESVYFPNKDYAEIYNSLTPINLMRIITNKSLGSKLKILEDKQVFTRFH